MVGQPYHAEALSLRDSARHCSGGGVQKPGAHFDVRVPGVSAPPL